MKADTILAQLDHFLDPATGSLVPPIQLGVTSRPPGSPSDAISFYARSGNEASRLLERLMATLEGAAAALAFGSAAGAMTAVLANLRPGDHVLVDTGAYYEFGRFFAEFGERWQIVFDLVDVTDLPAVRAGLQPGRTKLVWAECPSNPLWRVPDIAALADCAHGVGARLLVDATVATPILCTPLRLGADLVLHSATKYLNGHGDVLAGVLATATEDPAWHALAELRTRHGSVLGAFEAWLILRGMRTLALRMARVSDTAMQVATMLAAHPAVSVVHYPGLPADPWHAAAAAQFIGAGFGGMVSFQLHSEPAALAVCAALRVFRRATSLGSPESLVEHRLTTEGPGSACPPALLRLSIGFEAAADLLADLEAALATPAPAGAARSSTAGTA